MWRGNSALGLIVVFLALAEAGAAQQEPKPKDLPDAPAPKQENAPAKHENPLNETIQILGRRSIFFPDLATNPKPLNSKQKFELSADESIAPSRLLSSALGAGIGQAADSLPGYGEGMAGYAKRFGSSMASAASDHFFETFLLSSLLHRDPRYFVVLRGGAGYRIKYALSRTVVTRTDDGKSAANWPGILGPLLAESLANSYLPEKEQTTGRTFRRYGYRVGLNTASKVLREYWPTIFRSLRIAKIAPGARPDPGPAAPFAPLASTATLIRRQTRETKTGGTYYNKRTGP
jgi:hypothetical protein